MSFRKFWYLQCGTFAVIFLFTWLARESTASSLSDREVTAMFRSGIINPPGGAGSFDADSTSVLAAAVLSVLSSYGVESIIKAFPDMTPADTLIVTHSGETVGIPQYSEVYRLRMPTGSDPGALASSLDHMQGVIFAEPNVSATPAAAPAYPNDSLFVNGSQWSLWNRGQSGGAYNADVQAPEAWGSTTGTDSVTLAIIDSDFDFGHPEFSGRVLTSLSDHFVPLSDHGFEVAGVAAATGNNGFGVAGIDWRCKLISLDNENPDSTYIANQIIRAANAGAKVINNSYGVRNKTGQETDALIVHSAIATAYEYGCVTTAAMGNSDAYKVVWPAGYKQDVIAVGATTRTDTRWSQPGGLGSAMGQHIDVVAPGADMMVCQGNGTFILDSGTSFATPIVSGIAALLRAKDPDLYHDDVQEILHASAKDLGPAGFDSAYGYGRVDARRALEMLGPPNILDKPPSASVGGVDVGNTGPTRYQMRIIGQPEFAGTWWVVRHDIRRYVAFNKTFTHIPRVWGRASGGLVLGESADNPNFAEGWCGVLPGTVTAVGCSLQTYIYELYAGQTGGTAFWFPVSSASQVRYRWAALQVEPVPDVSQSFYVPQRGSVGTPQEGGLPPNVGALLSFRTCPNNDAFTPGTLAQNARIKVVIKDAVGAGIPGIQSADIFILLNGGTPAQGFVGDGADSVIANSTYNPAPQCPDLRAIEADAPTDAQGVTYITFTGKTPGSPGVGTRDPARKWGHYDTELPVYVLGQKLSGRLTSSSANGTYSLQIKNFDFKNGLGTFPNVGEVVDQGDFNTMVNLLNTGTYNWWADFDSNGVVDQNDVNQFIAHYQPPVVHDCDSPNNP